MSLYLDDSGASRPDRHPKDRVPQHGCDWFALGGILIREADEPVVTAQHAKLCSDWSLTGPLHSTDIRGHRRAFSWLGTDKGKREHFMADLGRLITSSELTAIACVVDRPGYNARYRDLYGRARWKLCKTAFNVVVERAAKYARYHGCKLRVYVERCNKKTDDRFRAYFDRMRDSGLPFDAKSSAKYAPLLPEDFRQTLYEFRTKTKQSELMQLADMALYPMCIGQYHPEQRAYQAMFEAGVLINCKLDSERADLEGIKRSCFELVDASKNQSPEG
jgi:hypothetical protein